MKGRLIVFEGIDGAGTTTHSRKLVRYLKERGLDPVWTDYTGAPEKNQTAELIDRYLHKKADLSPQALFMLFSALHTQNTERVRKWLAQGKVAVLDRYLPSALAFQCAQGVKLEAAQEFVRQFSLKPDAVIYLKITPETGLRRKRKQGKEIDRHEEDLKFLQRVSDMYDKLAADSVLGPWFIIDAEKPIGQVFSEVRNVADKIL